MRELVREREDLRGFRVSPVDEHERRQTDRQERTPELAGVELPVRVAADDAVDHHEDAARLPRLRRADEARP